MKLIECSAFVLEQNKEYWSAEIGADKFQRIVSNYAKFLRQKLELWMFIPCDAEGKILEEPEKYKGFEDRYQKFDIHSLADCQNEHWYYRCKDFKKAKSRCLFEGFEYSLNHIINPVSGAPIFERADDGWKLSDDCEETIEDLVPYGLTLTATAIKKIGL